MLAKPNNMIQDFMAAADAARGSGFVDSLRREELTDIDFTVTLFSP